MKRRFNLGSEQQPEIKRMKRQRNNWKEESYLNTKWGHVTGDEPPIAGKVNPDIVLMEFEEKIFDFLIDVVKKNNLHETVLRVAGGWVRDKVLGAESDDIDIAINNMTGSEFCKFVVKDMEEGKKFAVIQSNPEQSKHLETSNMTIFGRSIDFVNLRTEEYASDERIPTTMGMGTPLEDALRRDLTINTLFYNINTRTVEDFTKSGIDDLKENLIRTPLDPHQTFLDDPLRILRSIRFASRFNFSLHEKIFEVCQTELEVREALQSKISRERVGIEIRKMLKTNDPPGGFALIDELEIRGIVFAISDPLKKSKKKKKKKKKGAVLEFENPIPIPFSGNIYPVGLSRMRMMIRLLNQKDDVNKLGLVSNDMKEAMFLSSFFSVITTEQNMKNYEMVSSFCDNLILNSLRYSKLLSRNMSILSYFSRFIHHNYITTIQQQEQQQAEEEEEEEGEGEKCLLDGSEEMRSKFRKLVFHEKKLEIGKMIRRVGKELFYPTVVMSIVHSIQVNEIVDSIHTQVGRGRVVIKNLVFWEVLNEENFFQTVVEMRPLMNGKEVAELLKIRPGRIISTILESLICKQILEPKMTKEQAEEFVKMKFGK